ncbi:MAG: hypothetical protein JSR82_22515 [Verrucomicrobia bacterium]|nr:hypothetical protein [Verrucomicrobiota bacterium]
MLKLLALFLATAAVLLALHLQFGPIRHPPGVLIPAEPTRGAASGTVEWDYGAWKIAPLASYDVEARVLGTKTYRRDRLAEICDLDLALGWRRCSDSAVLDRLKIWQEGRFFWWRSRGREMPLPRGELEASMANTHVIAASPRVADELAALRPGHLVRLRGQLIEARHPDGTRFRSSLRRDDTGKGACEILWVEAVEARIRPPQ